MSKSDAPQPPDPARRRFFQAAGAAAALPAALPLSSHAQGARPPARAYVFFNPAEAAFIEAAVARLIPKDETGPGALEGGVPSGSKSGATP
jgi:gluconate 2-dehydrogenase gamma chain